MAKINTKPETIKTHEGASVQHINPELQLRRSVMACMLWEATFYESGESISDRIVKLIPLISPVKVAALAVEAREKMKLRHVPLLLVREMARLETHKRLVAETLARIIQRPDEITEFVALYWKDKRQPLSAQIKRGLSAAFNKFNEYQFAKYDRKGKIKLRDVLFLSHAAPKNEEQAILFAKLVARELTIPDTWEVALSTGKDKKETWERLITENKLGGLAFLRNLRNMQEVGVDVAIIKQGLEVLKSQRILPFRFISAAKYAPQLEPDIEKAMLKCLEGKEKLPGKTVLLVDGSGSMFGVPVSKKSEIDCFEAGAALAILLYEICEECQIFVFSNLAKLVPSRKGFALRDVLYKYAGRAGTYTQRALDTVNECGEYDRLILITDEQSHQTISPPTGNAKGYIVNVATYQNGIGYGAWTHIDGFSENIMDYIIEAEKELMEN